MNYRVLGRTSIQVSEIAFGGVEIGLPYGIKVSETGEMPTEEEAIGLLLAALEGGITFFDTARSYGRSEEIMGKAFKKRRREMVINTKCVPLRDADKKIFSAPELRRIIPESLEKSLQTLQMENVDIYMTHTGDAEVQDRAELREEFQRMKEKGLTRAIGISTYTPEDTRKAIESGVWDVIQLPFNLMDQRQAALFPLARQHGVGIVVRSVLLKGILSDRGRELHPALEDISRHRGRLLELIDGQEKELPRAATRFALGFAEVSSVLVGIDRREYLEDALETAQNTRLDPDLFEAFRRCPYPDPDFINLAIWDRKGWLH